VSEKDINRWHATITPRDKAPQPWTLGSGGSWDMLQVQPIPDAMLAELAQRYHYAGTPWNCRSMPLSDGDREYMYLLYSCMQGLVARMRLAEKAAARYEWLRNSDWDCFDSRWLSEHDVYGAGPDELDALIDAKAAEDPTVG